MNNYDLQKILRNNKYIATLVIIKNDESSKNYLKSINGNEINNKNKVKISNKNKKLEAIKSEKDKKDNDKIYNSLFSIIEDVKESKTFNKNENIVLSHLEGNNSDICNNITLWETLTQKISNVKNQLVFNCNLFTGNNNLDLKSEDLPQEIQIFDDKFSKQDEKLINKLKNIPYFSYRKNFDVIKEEDKNYTSDAGWGCILRVSQMFLAQGIYQLFSFKNLESFANEYISYFYDNNIPKEFLNTFKNNTNKKEDKNNNSFLMIDSLKGCKNSFVDVPFLKIKGLENIVNRCKDKKYITPPFSLRNFSKVQKKINPKGKKMGDWFSNFDVTRIITAINKSMLENGDCDFKILSFEDVIYMEDIMNNCFEEEIQDIDFNGFEIISSSTIQDSYIYYNKDINKDYNSKIYIFNKKRYLLKNKFLIFISKRTGEIDEEFIDEILKIFDIKTNIGIIGGRNSRAFYFIGKCEKNLIFLDPHYVQPTIPLTTLKSNGFHESYRTNNIYYMPINEMSPSFSIGFAIKDMKEFKMFMEKIISCDYFIDESSKNSFGNKKNYIFKVKSFHFPFIIGKESNQDISNHVKIIDNYLKK